ncbi:MAG: aldehyde dehydrogenase family protein, partial [Oscillospiraceae bacterium]
ENCNYDDILAQKYDYVFFTGSSRVGKIVMEACAKNLTPLSLELGGKSPCFVDADANIDISAKRIVWGKLLNSGQTCVAPDYVIVDNRVKGKFINRLEYHINAMYPNSILNDDYPKIINQSAFLRLTKLIDEEKEKIGGNYNIALEKIEPAIFTNSTFESDIMQDEIFGPIIPIIGYDDLQSVINIVKSKEKPLALYIFSEDKNYCNKILTEISYGGGCINDTVVHLANHNIPFGGVGLSGMGNYHGKFGFDTFSHKKSIVKNKTTFDIPLRYAPFKNKNIDLIKKVVK